MTLSYLKGYIRPSFLLALTKRLESNLQMEADDLQGLTRVLGQTRFTMVTHYQTSETPKSVVRALKKGKAVIFIESFPLAVVLPSLISDIFITDEDRSYRNNLDFHALLPSYRSDYYARGSRFICLVSICQSRCSTPRFELAHSIAKSRLEVPYPAFLETLLMMFILELLIEALIRLPSSIGSSHYDGRRHRAGSGGRIREAREQFAHYRARSCYNCKLDARQLSQFVLLSGVQVFADLSVRSIRCDWSYGWACVHVCLSRW